MGSLQKAFNWPINYSEMQQFANVTWLDNNI